MAEISNGPDRRLKDERELTGRRSKDRCNIELHKDMERAWEEREAENQQLKEELRRMKEEAEQAERAQEAERSLLERCKDKIKKGREKKIKLIERARAMIQEETDRRKELEEKLEKMNKELERLQHMEKKMERHLRKNLEEQFEERLQKAIQETEMKKSVEMETFKAMCREEQNLKYCHHQLQQPRMRTTGKKRQQQLDTLNEKTLNVSLTGQHAEGDQAKPKPLEPIMCQPRPWADLTPESWLQTCTRPEPGPDSESDQDSEPEMSAEARDIVIDIEFDDSERVDDVIHKGRIIPWSEIEEAKQKLLKESEEAECKLLSERCETERWTVVEELKKQHKQFPGDDDEASQEGEDDQAELSVDEVGREKLFRDEAERKAFIKKSKRRRAVYWVNKMVRKNHEEMIRKTYVNEENKGKQLDNGTTRAELEQEKRARLLRAEEKRKRLYEEGLRSQKEKSQKKQANRQQNTERSNCQSYPKEDSE